MPYTYLRQQDWSLRKRQAICHRGTNISRRSHPQASEWPIANIAVPFSNQVNGVDVGWTHANTNLIFATFGGLFIPHEKKALKESRPAIVGMVRSLCIDYGPPGGAHQRRRAGHDRDRHEQVRMERPREGHAVRGPHSDGAHRPGRGHLPSSSVACTNRASCGLTSGSQ
nr:GRP family sugar transporter [Olsenella uli]